MNRINGRDITLKIAGKFYSGITEVGFDSSVISEKSLIKEDGGIEQEEIIGFDEKFSISGIVCVNESKAAVAQACTVTLTGSAGTANITQAGGLTKLLTYATSLTATAAAFVTANAAAYLAVGIVVTSNTNVLTFTANVPGIPFLFPSIVNATLDISGSTANTVLNVYPINDTLQHSDWAAIRTAYRAKLLIPFVYGMFSTGKPEISGNLQLLSYSEKTGSNGKATYSAGAKIVQDAYLTYGATA